MVTNIYGHILPKPFVALPMLFLFFASAAVLMVISVWMLKKRRKELTENEYGEEFFKKEL